jgi:glycerophosphoryl diester phosphodiesterase
VGVLVIAHRGASGSAPENTLAAFRRAAALGAHMIELDVQLTRDGAAVVVHDWSLERTTDGRGAVRDHDLAALQRLDAGRWFAPHFAGERIPTLTDVLAAVRLPVNVELKPVGADGLEAVVLADVVAAGALDRVVFSSFDGASLGRLRALAPGATLAVLWENDDVRGARTAIERVAATALHLRKDAARPEVLAGFGPPGIPVRVWTVNDPDEFSRLVWAGVQGIFSDYPERFLHSHAAE